MQDNEIRILDILPCGIENPEALLKCKVRVVNLSNKPFYDALSYRWGDPGSKRCIFVDDQEFFVTENLHAALLRLRKGDAIKTIWIDQLCIDQQNQKEKVVQVRLMGTIYSNCHQCLIWMDEIEDSIPQADAEAILDVLRWMADRSLPVPPCTASVSAFHGPIHALSSIGIGVHPWWYRVWTIQEAILPSNKVFLWGPLQLPWDTLTRCARVWTGSGVPPELSSLLWRPNTPDWSDFIDRTMGWLFCNVIWINSAHAQREEPVQTVMKWRGRKATDPRDKVFGLLGLLPLDMELHYTDQCDYGTCEAQIYSAFNLDVILDHGGLLPLVVQQRAPWGKGTKDLPTWVSDMSDCEMPNQVDRFYRRWGYEAYDACAGRRLKRIALTDEVQDSTPHSPIGIQTLKLSGVAVDAIAMTGTKVVNISAQNSAKVAETLRSWMEMARKYHEALDSSLLGESLAKAFYKVLVSDRIRDGEQWVARRPNQQDFADISGFVETGQGTINNLWFWDRYVGSQTFFITKNGTMGLGIWETEVGDEVWVFDGGRMPFTIRARQGESQDDFDFVGCCYADGIMDGEIYEGTAGRSVGHRRTIRLH